MIEVEANGQRYQFPDGTPDDVISGAIDRDLGIERAPKASPQTDPMTPRTDLPNYNDSAPAQERGMFSRTRELGGEGLSAAGNIMSSFKPGGSSPTAAAIPDSVPLYGKDGPQIQIPDLAKRVVGRIGDLVMIPASALSGIAGGAAGAVGDVADIAGMNPNSADRLANDIQAIPEAFAGTPTIFGNIDRPARAPQNIAPDAKPRAPVNLSVMPETGRTAQDVGSMVRSAANKDRPTAGTRRLAENMDVNPDAAAAAQRLGMDLPADVLSDSVMVREAAGMTRSQVGSEASANFQGAVRAASTRADEALQTLGGSADISLVSSNVKDGLDAARLGLNEQSNKLYAAVDAVIEPGQRIEPNNIVRAMNGIIGDLGGTDGMTAAERRLFDVVTSDQPVTYARLLREKRLVGRAIERGDGPYADVDQSALKRIYGAMADDQIDNVGRIAGDEVAGNLRAANELVSQRKDLEGQIVGAFGKDLEGSIGNKLRAAITSGAKGDIANLNRIINVIPEDLRAEGLLTAITAQAQSNVATAPGFDFAKFSKIHEGIRANTQVEARLRGVLGADAMNTMADLADVSRRITAARGAVITTGKANQQLLQSMAAEGVMSRVLSTTAGRAVARTAGAGAGSVAGGPLGAVGGAQISENLITALSKGEKARVEAAGRMFSSPEFQKMAVEAATGTPSQATIDAVTSSTAYRRWAQRTGINNPGVWMGAAVLSASQENNGSEQDQQAQ